MNKRQPFFTHPMRPFFTASALLAAVAALSFFASPNAIILHRQIFLEFMLPAAYGGFLMAAMLEWTGYQGSLKNTAFLLGALLMLLAAFTVFQTAYAYTNDLNLLRAQVHLNMAAVMFVSFRVSIFLGNEALKECRLKDPVFIPNMVYKNIAITFLLLYAAAELWLPLQTAAFAALAVGLVLLAKLRELHHHELLRKHYVRTCYWLQLLGAAGYLRIGFAKLTGQAVGTPPHLITLGAIFGGVMMVWLTAGLWHSGFTKLNYPRLCRIAVPCLFLSALTRTVWVKYAPGWLLTAIPALLLATVFVLYLFAFIPIFNAHAFTDDPE
ncbi:NnrS family protein [Neisseria chenwenguii]|uniref:Uncharacterized protein n=1 Tax=Neisseria chenwenguii TaxID=1853278 RepID=A0A220S3Z3_9NEIS|nr:NnrS family protein [Neisseria chenwenguii]ASK28053.1 hypothetical protein BG910_10230 [Neisseria chenwenguii]ROV57203.1 hypothetical protein EGS38_00490 [Neisseria chenwenguii]